MIDELTFERTRRALPGWSVEPSRKKGHMRVSRGSTSGGVSFEVTNAEDAKRLARQIGEVV